METLLVCPRCGAFVQPEWSSCRICGYNPHDASTHGPIERPARVRERVKPATVIGGLCTLALLAALAFGVVRGGIYLWDHRSGPVNHQEYVVIER